MAALDEIIDTGNVEESFSPRGHNFRFAFSVLNLFDVQPYTFKQDIETKCDNLPTLWSFEFIFKQTLDTNFVSRTVIVKRADSIYKTVSAELELSYGYVKDMNGVEFEQLLTEEYAPHDAVQDDMDNILPFPEENEKYLEGGITVQVSFTIKCCHRPE